MSPAVWAGLLGLVAGAAPDFETGVIPVLTRAGCNSGACHGAAVGRGGFRLSLLGYDPQADYDAILHEFEGRRANRVKPERSLLLRKPSMQTIHEGGMRLAPGGDGYRIVLDWLKAGAPRGPARTLQALELSPPTRVLDQPGSTFSMQVTARYRDGTREDVTRWAVFTPTDAAALRCTPRGEVTALRRGQHQLLVRFLGEVGCVTALVPLHDQLAGNAKRPRANWIDDHVNRTLDQLRLPHAPRADEATLVRRITLDLLGRLPDPEEVDAFVRATDDPEAKWQRLLDRLLDRPEFADYQAYQAGDLYRIESGRLGTEGAAAFHQWVRDQIRRNVPLDRQARALVLALGDGSKVGPANFSRVPADARGQAEYVSQVFLGVRLQCANCHNHPLDRWTQDDYHGLAAVFARVGRGRVVALQDQGEVIHPKTGQPARTRLPGERFLDPSGDPRERLTDWLTARDNPYFARAAVNRLWRSLMGRGLVEPVDDHRATNPATHPELLEALACDFAAHGYDLRHTLRVIATSEAYRRSARAVAANRGDDRFYSHARPRPLPPPVLVDAVARVTGVPERLGDAPLGTAAVTLGDSRVASEPLDLLGRCRRDGGCDPAPADSGTLPLALHVINGPWLNAKITHPDGRLQALLRGGASNADVVATFYCLAYGRAPEPAELAHWQRALAADGPEQRRKKLEDFLWALLNSAEFGRNH